MRTVIRGRAVAFALGLATLTGCVHYAVERANDGSAWVTKSTTVLWIFSYDTLYWCSSLSVTGAMQAPACVVVNSEYKKLPGYKRDDVLGRPVTNEAK